MEQEQVIQRIKELGERILPEGASLWLYGSRARGDARPDSDYDLLILLDKDILQERDTDVIYDMAELGWGISAEINAHAYPRNKWNTWTYLPFYKNVEREKIVLR
jgi:predicted nucleotidyltransferase